MWVRGREDGSIHALVACRFLQLLLFMTHFPSSHLWSPPALSCSVHVFLGTPAGTGTGQSGWNALWEASLLWYFQVFFQVSQTESCYFFWSHAAVLVLWCWNQAAHEGLHFPVVSNSPVLWNLLSILSSGCSDAMTRWHCYQQLHTFFPNLDSENLNLEETRNTEAGKAMVTLPHVYPWSRVRHVALSLKRTWRKATTSSRKVKQNLRIRQQKDPKLPGTAELRRTDPEERRIFSSASLKRKMNGRVEQSSGSRTIPKLYCWKPWEVSPGAPVLGMWRLKVKLMSWRKHWFPSLGMSSIFVVTYLIPSQQRGCSDQSMESLNGPDTPRSRCP